MNKFLRTILASLILVTQLDIRVLHAQMVTVYTPLMPVTLTAPVITNLPLVTPSVFGKEKFLDLSDISFSFSKTDFVSLSGSLDESNDLSSSPTYLAQTIRTPRRPLAYGIIRADLLKFSVANWRQRFSFGSDQKIVTTDIHFGETLPVGRNLRLRPDYPDSDTNAVTVSVNGLLTSDTSKSNVTVTYAYDSLERSTGVTDPRAGTTVTKYNTTTGQVDFVRDAAGNKVSYTYDSQTGRKATETDALNHVTRFEYNNRNQVTRTWGDVPYPVEYVYDTYGRVHEMHTWRTTAAWNGATWPSGVAGQEDITTWNYQEATGLLTSKVDDNAKSVTYTYTTAGQLATRTWARTPAITTTYGYDPNTGELLTVNYSDSTPDVTFTYDRLGRSKTVADGLGSRTFSYNTALQPDTESITGLYNASITRTYAVSGVVGRPTGLTTGSLYTQTYGYDTKGRYNTTGWTVNALSGSATYTYVTNSDLLGTLTTASGQSTTYTYEANRNLRTQIKNQFSSTTVSQYDYVYDALGRRTSVKNSGTAFSAAAFNRFVYDNRNELGESARYLGTDINILTSPVTGEYRSFTYDPIGNRTNITVAANNGTYAANNLNQYSTENVAGGGTNTFTHDFDGNLTQISGVKNVQYVFNAENQVVTMQPTTPALNDKKVESVYDYQGRRVQKVVSNWTGVAWVPLTTKRFVYDGWNVIEEQTVAGTSKYYVWGLDLSQSLQGAGGVGGLLAKVEGASTHHYLYDGNGNVGQLVNATTGLTDAHYEYDPYGNSILATGSQAASNPYRFSTKYLDNESGLYYYGYRYYDSLTGRWLSRDPIDEEGGENIYAFVLNSPSNFIDSYGLQSLPTTPNTTFADDLEALAMLNAIDLALNRPFTDRPITALLLRNYLLKKGDLTLPKWAIKRIEKNSHFNSRKGLAIADVITNNKSANVKHVDIGFPRGVSFDPSHGDLFSAFADLQFGVDLDGCVEKSGGKIFFIGTLRTRYNDWWGFSLFDSQGKYIGKRRPLTGGLSDFVRKYPKLPIPNRLLNIQEYRFVALQSRGWVRPFFVEGEKVEKNVKIEVRGQTSVVEPMDSY